MSKLLEIGVLSVGGLCLFAVSFVGFALSAGVPMRDVAVIGPLFEESGPAPAPAQKAPSISQAPELTDEQIIQSNLGLLSTWSFDSSVDPEAIQAIVDRVKAKEEDLDRRELEVARQESYVADRLEALSEQHEVLEDIRAELESMDSNLRLRQEEVRRDEDAELEKSRAHWVETSKLFVDGDAAGLAPRLLKFAPEESGLILRALPPDRATELLDALPDDDWKTYADAYTRAAQ